MLPCSICFRYFERIQIIQWIWQTANEFLYVRILGFKRQKKKRTLFRSTLLLLDFFCLDRMSCVRNAVLRFLLIFIGLFNWSGFFFSFFSSRKMSRMLHFANSFCSGVSNRSGGKYYRPCCHAPVFRHHLHHRLCLSIIKWFLSSVPREIKFLFN